MLARTRRRWLSPSLKSERECTSVRREIHARVEKWEGKKALWRYSTCAIRCAWMLPEMVLLYFNSKLAGCCCRRWKIFKWNFHSRKSPSLQRFFFPPTPFISLSFPHKVRAHSTSWSLEGICFMLSPWYGVLWRDGEREKAEKCAECWVLPWKMM